MDVIKGKEVTAWWFNPRNGESVKIATYPGTGTRTFIPPSPGENLDWVLVLDDASGNYPPPGNSRLSKS